eukprot:644946-Prymnesium_polylepis.1
MGAPYNVNKLETFMCDGVAARLDDEAFLAALLRLTVLNKHRATILCRSFPPLKRARRLSGNKIEMTDPNEFANAILANIVPSLTAHIAAE